MNMETFILIVMIFYPSPDGVSKGFDKETRPVEVPVCSVDATGARTEDSNCGIKACMRTGRERAAVISGQIPGAGFGLICTKPNGTEVPKEGVDVLKEGSEPSPGHGGMNWR